MVPESSTPIRALSDIIPGISADEASAAPPDRGCPSQNPRIAPRPWLEAVPTVKACPHPRISRGTGPQSGQSRRGRPNYEPDILAGKAAPGSRPGFLAQTRNDARRLLPARKSGRFSTTGGFSPGVSNHSNGTEVICFTAIFRDSGIGCWHRHISRSIFHAK